VAVALSTDTLAIRLKLAPVDRPFAVLFDVADSVAHAAQLMTEHGFSQVPVTSGGRIVGAISEQRIYSELVKNPDIRTQPVETIMDPAFPLADISIGIDALATMMASRTQAVLVRDFKTDEIFIITRSDVIKALS